MYICVINCHWLRDVKNTHLSHGSVGQMSRYFIRLPPWFWWQLYFYTRSKVSSQSHWLLTEFISFQLFQPGPNLVTGCHQLLGQPAVLCHLIPPDRDAQQSTHCSSESLTSLFSDLTLFFTKMLTWLGKAPPSSRRGY